MIVIIKNVLANISTYQLLEEDLKTITLIHSINATGKQPAKKADTLTIIFSVDFTLTPPHLIIIPLKIKGEYMDNIIIYNTDDGQANVKLYAIDGTVWPTLKAMAELVGVQPSAFNRP